MFRKCYLIFKENILRIKIKLPVKNLKRSLGNNGLTMLSILIYRMFFKKKFYVVLGKHSENKIKTTR